MIQEISVRDKDMPRFIETYVPPSVIVRGNYEFQGESKYIQPSTLALVVRLDSYPTKTANRTLSNGSTAVIDVRNLIEDSVTLRDYAGGLLTKDVDYKLSVDADNDTFSVTITKQSIKGQTILISYKYLPDNFFEPLAWYTLASVADYYGPLS